MISSHFVVTEDYIIMKFWKSVFTDKKDNRTALILFVIFSLLYILLNIPYLTYMEEYKDILLPRSPFNDAPFTLNLFNFDPSFYYAPQSSFIHPLLNFVATPLKALANATIGNALFVGVQSMTNALCVVILYYYLRRNQCCNWLSISTAAFFGASSYSIFTALIPDSYPYAVFGILLTVLYAQYCRQNNRFALIPVALLLVLNFGITITNVATAAGVLFFCSLGQGKQFIVKWVKVAGIFAVMVALLTVFQHVLFSGNTWVSSWQHNIEAGGMSYVSPFSFKHHWKAVYSMIESPIITPNLVLMSDSIMAFVTNLAYPFPWYGHLVGAVVIILSLLAIGKGYRSAEVWSLNVYPLFAILLHLVVGFGLRTFEYDMYLYAGHYLFALFLLMAWFIHSLRGQARRVLTGIVAACAVITLLSNIMGHMKALDTVKQTYAQIQSAVMYDQTLSPRHNIIAKDERS